MSAWFNYQAVLSIIIAGLLIGPAVPNATSRVIIIAPMLQELVEALGYRARSRPAAGLAMAVLIGFGQMSATFLTSSTVAILVLAVLPVDAQKDLNWVTWAFYGAPANFILFVGPPRATARAPADNRSPCSGRCSARCRATRRSRSAPASACCSAL